MRRYEMRHGRIGRVLTTMAMVGLLSVASGAAVSAQEGGGTVTVAVAGDIGSLDPAAWRGAEAAYIEYQMYETLLRLDPETSEIVPGLAESWESPDPLTYILHLRDDVTFWDGTPMTAEDVVYSYERAQLEDVGAWNAPEYAYVESYEAIDPHTVQINLTEPDNLLIPHLTGTMGVVVSKAHGEANGPTSFATNPMGTGPFRFVSQDPSQVRLERYDGYWQEGLPLADELVFSIVRDPNSLLTGLRSGELQTTFSMPLEQMPTVEAMDELQVQTAPSTLLHFMMIHADTPPLDDVNVRKAIAYAADNAAAMQAYSSEYIVPATGSPAAPIDLYGGSTETRQELEGSVGIGNMEMAREALAASSAPDGFDVTLTYQNDTPLYDTYALFLQQQLAELGINVTLNKLPVGEYLSRAYGGALDGLEISGWYNTYPNPAGILIPLASESALGSTNRNFYVDPEFEAAADVAVHGDPAEMDEAIATMEKKVIEDVVFLPIAYAANVQVSTEGLQTPPMSPILIWQPWAAETGLAG
jgi:peptide/nickel transport system substrate-binding protein